MKTNTIKDYALSTIEKAQELSKKAEDAHLLLCIDVDICTNSGSISLYELDNKDNIKGSSIYFRHFCWLNKVENARRFANCLAEVEGEIANYKEKDLERMEKRQADLRKELAEVNKDLRRVKRNSK